MAKDMARGPEHNSRIRIVGPLVLAIVADFALQSILGEGGGERLRVRVAQFVVGAVATLVYGWWLGTRAWPRRGRQLARYLLLRELKPKRGARPLVYLSDRPDFPLSMTRRVLELVAFSAGLTIIVVAVLTAIGAPLGLIAAASFGLLFVSLWGAFILVPYWVFGRMGLRQVDPMRWLVQPLSRTYASRLRLSNGALLLIAMGAVFNLAFRAGASPDNAIRQSILDIGHVVASVLIAATTGVVFYLRQERELVREFEAEALRDGARDGRGMTDGEFLPRKGERAGEDAGRAEASHGPRAQGASIRSHDP